MPESKTRIYVVRDSESMESDNDPRLVRAISAAQAIRHCADHYAAEVATQDVLVRLLGDGVDVEDATKVRPQA